MNESSWLVLSTRGLSCMVWGWVGLGMASYAPAGEELRVVVGQQRPQRSSTSLAPASNIPAAIQAEAARRGVALSSVKQQGEYWVACEGDQAEGSCLVLGRATNSAAAAAPAPVRLTGLTSSAMLDVYQYGQAVQTYALNQASAFGRVVKLEGQGLSFELSPGVEARVAVQGRKDQVIDTLPKYRREAMNLVRTKDFQLVRDYIDARPDEPFTVVVTVPALCEPCRKLDKLLHDGAAANQPTDAAARPNGLRTKMFVLEYFSFADAEREVLGTGAVFPTTLVYGVEAQPRRSIARLIGNLRGSTPDEISRPLAERFRRGSPHTLSRGVVLQELLFRPAGERLTQR